MNGHKKHDIFSIGDFTDELILSVYLPISSNDMNRAATSADIIPYTSLNGDEKRNIESKIKNLAVEVSERRKKSQSAISQYSTAAGWQSINKSVNYFEKYTEHAI